MWNPSGCDREGSIVVSFIGRSSGDGVEFQKNANLPGKECPNCGPVEVVRECSHGPCILSLACRRMLAIILNFDKMDY